MAANGDASRFGRSSGPIILGVNRGGSGLNGRPSGNRGGVCCQSGPHNDNRRGDSECGPIGSGSGNGPIGSGIGNRPIGGGNGSPATNRGTSGSV